MEEPSRSSAKEDLMKELSHSEEEDVIDDPPSINATSASLICTERHAQDYYVVEVCTRDGETYRTRRTLSDWDLLLRAARRSCRDTGLPMFPRTKLKKMACLGACSGGKTVMDWHSV